MSPGSLDLFPTVTQVGVSVEVSGDDRSDRWVFNDANVGKMQNMNMNQGVDEL